MCFDIIMLCVALTYMAFSPFIFGCNSFLYMFRAKTYIFKEITLHLQISTLNRHYNNHFYLIGWARENLPWSFSITTNCTCTSKIAQCVISMGNGDTADVHVSRSNLNGLHTACHCMHVRSQSLSLVVANCLTVHVHSALINRHGEKKIENRQCWHVNRVNFLPELTGILWFAF